MKQCLVAMMVLVLSMVFGAGCTGSGSPTPSELDSDIPKNGFFLTMTQPTDESIVNADKVEVIGITVPKAVVSANGNLAEVDEEGNFTMMVVLEEGPNIIEVIASHLEGNEESRTLVIIYVP